MRLYLYKYVDTNPKRNYLSKSGKAIFKNLLHLKWAYGNRLLYLCCCCSTYAIDHAPTVAGGACKISSQRTRACKSNQGLYHPDHHIIYTKFLTSFNTCPNPHTLSSVLNSSLNRLSNSPMKVFVMLHYTPASS